MDTSELYVRPGMRWACRASIGSCGKLSVKLLVLDCRVLPLGSPTVMVAWVLPFE
jgi:hypothetical protein